MTLRLLFSTAVLMGGAPAMAQQQDEQLWLQVNANVPIARRLRLTVEQIERFSDRQKGLFQSELGVLFSYKLASNVELGAGYRRVGFHNLNRGPDEDRLRAQMVGTFGRVFTRFRIDARFSSQGDEIGFRVRPLIRYTHPLAPDGLALFATHESFVLPNSTRWGQRSGYERMRNTLGLALPLGKQINADLGYLNEYRLSRGGRPAQMGHALSLQLTVDLRPSPPRRPPDDESTY